MDLQERLELAQALEQKGQLWLDGKLIKVCDGLIHVESYDGPIENPMTWDTFTHMYLTDAGRYTEQEERE